jgi:hypothetical protein
VHWRVRLSLLEVPVFFFDEATTLWLHGTSHGVPGPTATIAIQNMPNCTPAPNYSLRQCSTSPSSCPSAAWPDQPSLSTRAGIPVPCLASRGGEQ